MRENRTSGTVWGVLGNWYPYHDCLSENLFLENMGTSSDGGLRYAEMYWK